jgi:hypothetical protein
LDASAVEVLEHRPRRPLLGPRRVRLLLVVVLLVGLPAAAWDRHVRGVEKDRVARCVEVATDASNIADRRVAGTATYVQPALSSSPPAELRRQLLGMISASGARVEPGLRDARGRCAATGVLLIHVGLQRVRDDCLALLDGQLRYLRAVAEDGAHAFESLDYVEGRCS